MHICYTLNISTIVDQLNKGNKPILLAVFLLGILVFEGYLPSRGGAESKRGIWGGPAAAKEILSADAADVISALYAQPAIAGMNRPQLPAPEPKPLELLGLMQSQPSPIGMSGGRGLPVKYNVAKGDTLSGIARRFGISAQTLIAVNPGVKTRSLQVGQELVVLPTSGILYQSRPGDTLQAIAASFKVAPDQIAEFNRQALTSEELLPGTTLIIPGVYLSDSMGLYKNKAVSGYFIKPVEGWSSGILHERNAVDIANACGTPVAAAAEGLVLDVAASGWNGGYGLYVYMEHPNGTKTRYAHLASTAVEIGDYLKQGDKIGAVGRTGEATGCHLHFEVEGAANPFAM